MLTVSQDGPSPGYARALPGAARETRRSGREQTERGLWPQSPAKIPGPRAGTKKANNKIDWKKRNRKWIGVPYNAKHATHRQPSDNFQADSVDNWENITAERCVYGSISTSSLPSATILASRVPMVRRKSTRHRPRGCAILSPSVLYGLGVFLGAKLEHRRCLLQNQEPSTRT